MIEYQSVCALNNIKIKKEIKKKIEGKTTKKEKKRTERDENDTFTAMILLLD